MPPPDRMLTAVLRAYQDHPNAAQTDAIFGTTASLLSSLNNPLNLTLLTSHFLGARSLWQGPHDGITPAAAGLHSCLRIISVYNTAAFHVRRHELENEARRREPETDWQQEWKRHQQVPPAAVPVVLSSEEWARAVAKGADERSPRWRHCLVLAGVLMGMEGEDRRSLSRGLRHTLENAVVTAANLALAEEDPARRTTTGTGLLGRAAVVLALTYAFPLLSSEHARQSLACDALLLAITEAMVGPEGFSQGDFLCAITDDMAPERGAPWWSAGSPSAAALPILEARPLVQNMGPLTRLAGFAVQNARSPHVVLEAQGELLGFTAALAEAWERCPLSGVDLTAEAAVLPADVLQGPWPALWQLLKKVLYTVVAALQPVMARALLDPFLRRDAVAPAVAARTLHALRNLAFVSSRQGAGSFQVYTFTYLTSLDILARYTDACVFFLEDTHPPAPAVQNSREEMPPPPLAQALLLFYLNTAEHLPLNIPTAACETLIVGPATALLAPTSWLARAQDHNEAEASSSGHAGANPRPPPPSLALELFEAAHSCVLSSLSCPSHSALTASLVPSYIEALLSSFPARVSPRQFRLAFRSVAQMVCPPYPAAAEHPDLAETLLEVLLWRATTAASVIPLPPAPSPSQGGQQDPDTVSEQTTLLLALADALPNLPPSALPDWLTRVAAALPRIPPDPRLRGPVRRRIWDLLAAGELDVERAAVGVAWWGVGGGRDLVLSAAGEPEAGSGIVMSGALGGAGGPDARSML